MKLYAVYLCGDTLPNTMYNDIGVAKEQCANTPNWMDTEILEIDLDDMVVDRYVLQGLGKEKQ